jgi:hypothetical protein
MPSFYFRGNTITTFISVRRKNSNKNGIVLESECSEDSVSLYKIKS